MSYEQEKPDSKRVIEQGYGYVEVHRVAVAENGLPTMGDDPVRLGYSEWERVEVRDAEHDNGKVGVRQTPDGPERIPIERLRPRPPGEGC